MKPEDQNGLKHTLLCLDCDRTFHQHEAADRAGRCPYCGSGQTTWLSKWIRPQGRELSAMLAECVGLW